jgi:hypothetical protein
MQIMRARAEQRVFCAAHNSWHYVELPTTEHGWAGDTGRRTKPGTHAGGKEQRRARDTAGWATAEPASGPSKRQRRELRQTKALRALRRRRRRQPQPPEHCPVCQATTAVARRDACAVLSASGVTGGQPLERFVIRLL